MELLFKVTTAPAPSTPLVAHTNFQEHYSGVNRSMAWADLTTAIRQATEKYVLPFIGLDFYNELAGLYQAGTAMSEEQERALELLQDTIAYYSIYHVLPEKNTVLATNGAVQNQPDGGANPTPQWAWKASRWAALENGDAFLDKTLAYMEAQVIANNEDFNLWKNSDAYDVKTSDFFRLTSQVDDYLNIQNSRRSFVSLVRYMRQVEEDVVKPILCTTLYDALLIADPTVPNKKLIPLVRRIVAYLGAYEAIPHHRVVIDGDGFRIVSQTDQFDDRRNLTNNTHENAIQALKDRCEKKGNDAVKELRKFLEDNIADYSSYASSTCREKKQIKSHSITQSPDGIGAVGIF